MKQNKSIINSKEVKKLVNKVVSLALKDCAYQHEANGEPYGGIDKDGNYKIYDPTEEMIAFASKQPISLKLTFDFYFEAGKRSQLVCQPTMDLTNIASELNKIKSANKRGIK